MSTEKVSRHKREKSQQREGKSSRICKGIAMNMLKQIYLILRVYIEKIIDYMFSLYWESKHKPIPDLSKRHAILAESAQTLAAKIRNKELKSEDLVKACIERINEVNPIINAITDERFEEAVKEARAIDNMIESGLPEEYFKEKPFLGVPFTTKESNAVAEMLNTLGLVCRRNTRAHEHSESVRLMCAAGALPIAVTNVPEVNKWQETRNLIFGQTNNPYHTGRSVGGSSGGEAALTAALATPISLCSDIGGSTRMPAFYCGLFGYNPTAGYTDLRGLALRSGKDPTMAAVGFISRHLEDLGPLTKIVAGDKAPLLDLDRPVNVKELKFYYMESSKDLLVSPVHEDLRRAMRRVITKLTEEASSTEHSPQPYQHRGFAHMYRLWKYAMTLEADEFARLLTDNRGRANGLLELAKKVCGMSQYTMAAILKLLDDQVMPRVNKPWAEELIEEFTEDLTRLLGSDGVLLMPSAPAPAPYHYMLHLRPFNFAYWGVVNVLKMPAIQVPLGLNSEGLPIGIQVVAGPRQDALCLAVAKHLSQSFECCVPPCRVEV